MSILRPNDPADRLIVALDLPSARSALALVERLDGQCRWFKVGLELFVAEGPAVVRALRERGFSVFLDLKLHDIPNTVASAVRVAGRLDVSLLTVHAAGGPAMLRAAQDAAAGCPGMQLLGVTVLTSVDEEQMHASGVQGSAVSQVTRLGLLANASGLSGLVCSAQEAGRLRGELGAETLLVVPGIRPETSSLDDQRRVATPEKAIESGASMLVIGRPITGSADPASALQSILLQIDAAQNRKGSA